MATPGSGNATTAPQNSKSNGTILVVILVVVLSILALCVIGIVVIVYARRRARRYVRLRQSSEDGTAVEASASNSRPNTPWSSFLHRINIFDQSSSPVPYQPIQLPDTRHPAKVGNRLGDPNIPRSPPITDISSSALKVPNPTPKSTPASSPHRCTPLTPSRSVTVPPFFRVYQEVKRLAPPPESPIMRPPPPVRAPTAPVNLPSRNISPPSQAPIAVINIAAPPGFTIDDTPSLSMVPPTGANNKGRPSNLRFDSNFSGADGENNAEYIQSIPWYPGGARSIRTTATTQDSDSVLDQPSTPSRKRKKSVDEPMSPVSPRTDDSATTSGSIAGSSRPPTLTFKKVLSLANARKPVLFSLDVPRTMSFLSSQPHSHSRAPSHTRKSDPRSQSPPRYRMHLNKPRINLPKAQHAPQRPIQICTPPARTLPQILQSPPYNPSQLSESSSQNHQSRSRPREIHRSPEPIRRPLPTPDLGDASAQASRLDDHNLGTEGGRNDAIPDNHAQSGLFPSAVVGAGYRTKPNTVPTPLLFANAGPRSRYDPTAAPPSTPYSAFIRTNRI